MELQYLAIQSLLQNSYILKTIKADNCAFIVSFLYKTFRPQNKILASYPYDALLLALENHIVEINEVNYLQQSPKAYIDDWASDNKGIIIKTFSRENELFVSLSADTEKVFQWFEELMHIQQGGYVATDSRFNDIFNKLKEIKDKSVVNPQEKLTQLKKQKENIEQEIREIELGKNVFETLDEDRIIERFFETTEMAKRLISDFKQVERNIKLIINGLYERQLNPKFTAGSHLQFTFVAREELNAQPQGKSFEAFLNFQRNIDKQAEFEEMIAYVFALPYIQKLEKQDAFLLHLKQSLTIASQSVHKLKTDWISELNHAIIRHNNDSNKKITELVGEIKRLVMQTRYAPPQEKVFIEIEGKPEIFLPLERKLNYEYETGAFNNFQATDNEQNVEDIDMEMARMIENLNPLEKEKLLGNIQTFLNLHVQISLKSIVERYPITNGFSELLAYFQIAALSDKHLINGKETENIVVSKTPVFHKQVTIPQIIFRR